MKTRPYTSEVGAVRHGECVTNGLIVNYEEFKQAAVRAERLGAGLCMTQTQTRCWYEDSWTEQVIDWGAVAILLDRIGVEL